mmetsp:Transcript_5543/g.15561  ORF Transcript_5543/g.15561 Transcript_5543/m.15561 type:complete len:215 (-) Transcript_5543:170-814(-)
MPVAERRPMPLAFSPGSLCEDGARALDALAGFGSSSSGNSTSSHDSATPPPGTIKRGCELPRCFQAVRAAALVWQLTRSAAAWLPPDPNGPKSNNDEADTVGLVPRRSGDCGQHRGEGSEAFADAPDGGTASTSSSSGAQEVSRLEADDLLANLVFLFGGTKNEPSRFAADDGVAPAVDASAGSSAFATDAAAAMPEAAPQAEDLLSLDLRFGA